MLAWFALAIIAMFAAALFVPRLPRRVMRLAGAAAVSPQHEGAPAGEPAVQAVRVAVIEREPYDSGCLLVEAGERDP